MEKQREDVSILSEILVRVMVVSNVTRWLYSRGPGMQEVLSSKAARRSHIASTRMTCVSKMLGV